MKDTEKNKESIKRFLTESIFTSFDYAEYCESPGLRKEPKGEEI
jgi:hypothetical protein